MHNVTKFLVALCALACVALSALTMAYASNAETLRQANEDLQQRSQSVRDSASGQTVRAQEELAEAEVAMAQLRSEVIEVENKFNEMQQERENLLTEKLGAEMRADSVANQIGQLSATSEQQITVIQALQSEVAQVRTERLRSNKREIELLDRVSDLESTREVLEQTARALKEQLEEANYQLQIARSSDALADGGSTSDEPFVASGPAIRCSVLRLFESPAGYDMATISEGSNGGIRENMQMNIVNADGTQFLGKLVITHVETQEAVGRIDYLGRKTSIGTGDTVLSRLD